jgi:hypothetical protein
MAEGLTLDSGALIAAEKGEKRFWTYWEEALDRRAVVTVPVVVVAQVWRGHRRGGRESYSLRAAHQTWSTPSWSSVRPLGVMPSSPRVAVELDELVARLARQAAAGRHGCSIREGYVKPLRPSKRAAHIFAHQLMFLAVQESGLPRGDWNRRVDGSAAFSGLRGIALGSIVG